LQIVNFENIPIEVEEDIDFEFILSNSETAKGYGVEINSLSKTKSRNSSELIEGKHFLYKQVQTAGGKQKKIFWTKRGIVRLGFFIKSDRAKRFRDWVEDLILNSESTSKAKQEISYKEKVEAELLGLGFTFDRLRPNEASKVKMMKTTYGKLGLITSYLPKYSEEDLTYSLTHLLKKYEVGISTKDMNLILIEKGILEVLERSSKDRNGVKTFKSLTEKGLEFGKNLISPHNQLETQPHYFENKFEELLELISEESC
jgi:prophage antirepressor-like protein